MSVGDKTMPEIVSFHYYLGQIKQDCIERIIDSTEKLFAEKYGYWPSVELTKETQIQGPVVMAFKSNDDRTKIILIETQSYKFCSRLIALCSCPKEEKGSLEEILEKAEKRVSKIYTASERKQADKRAVSWIKEHRFILTILGSTGLSGGSLVVWLIRPKLFAEQSILDSIFYAFARAVIFIWQAFIIVLLIALLGRVIRIVYSKW